MPVTFVCDACGRGAPAHALSRQATATKPDGWLQHHDSQDGWLFACCRACLDSVMTEKDFRLA